MAKFVLIFHGGETPEEPSPDVMDRWMAWFGELGGAVVDMGAPFGASATIASDGTPSEGSGPDAARGYTVIEAANLHDAVVMAKGCPGLSSGGSVKLYEAMSMGCRLPDGSSFLDSTTYWWTTLRRSASVDRSL